MSGGGVASPEALNTEDGDDEYRNKPGRGRACHSLTSNDARMTMLNRSKHVLRNRDRHGHSRSIELILRGQEYR